MIDVVLYGREQLQRDEVSAMLHAENFWTRQVENNQQFNALNLDKFDLVIAIINTKSELLELNFLDFKQLPVIIITGSEPSFILKEKYPRNLVDIVTFAIEPKLLMRRIRNAILGLDFFEEKYVIPGPSGSLSEFNLLEVIQALMRREATGVLNINFEGLNSEIRFINGEIIYAACPPDYQGLDALDVILLAHEGTFEFNNNDSIQGEPEYDMQHILFHLVEKLSQYESLMEELPEWNNRLVLNPDNPPADDEVEQLKPYLVDGMELRTLLFKEEFKDKNDLLVSLNHLWRNGHLITGEEAEKRPKQKSGGLFEKLFGKKNEEIGPLPEDLLEETEKPEKSIRLNLTKIQLDKLKKALGQD